MENNDMIQYDNIYDEIRETLLNSRSQAYSAVNFALVQAYWHIGRIIVEHEQDGQERAAYGKAVLQELSVRLTEEFGKGFTVSNLKYMRQFYLTFPNSHALRGELTWTHYRLLLKVEDDNARQWYMNEAVASAWSSRQLERQISTLYYERLLSSRNKEPVIQEANDLMKPLAAEEFIKDPYVLDFLDLKNYPSLRESDLEQALIDKLQEFLLELGRGFSFVSRQKRFTLDGQDFFIDLVFYNYILKCFVLFDLKTDKLTHQDLGQMQMYVNYYTRELMNEGDNPPIGIVLCAEKNDAVVKYTLPEGNNQIFASKYFTYLPTEEELKRELRIDEFQKLDEE